MFPIVTKSRLVAKETDSLGYTTYVFLILEDKEKERLNTKYIMCTRWPHWDHRPIELYEDGYLSVTELKAGIDEWYDGNKFIKYRYNTIRFDKFIDSYPDIKRQITL